MLVPVIAHGAWALGRSLGLRLLALPRHQLLVVVVLLTNVCPWRVAHAHPEAWDILSESPLAHFREDDFARMMKNATEVLDADSPGAKQAWSNPKTGSSGFAEVRGGSVPSNGAVCKRLRLANKAEGFTAEGIYVACKQKEGKWKFQRGELPPKAAP